MLAACNLHSDAILRALDEAQVGDWVLLAAGQARRMGRLDYVPQFRERGADVILAMADSAAIARALAILNRAASGRQVCGNCLVYLWDAVEAPLATIAVDPVCGMVVQLEGAVTTIHDGVTYSFCSAECRERFLEFPETYRGLSGAIAAPQPAVREARTR
jgi:YHS domain-containing protein